MFELKMRLFQMSRYKLMLPFAKTFSLSLTGSFWVIFFVAILHFVY